MKWQDLLSQNRLWEEFRKDKIWLQNPLRNAYEKDYDRIIFSTYFKRLQNKTQVFPFPENTIIHNRLTHSIETSVVWRSLWKYVWFKVLEKEKELSKNISLHDFWEIVSASCLFHDIWNPPFWHSGENSISDFFISSKTWTEFISKLQNEKEINDFYLFEWNAQWLRILCDREKILPLTLAVIWTFCKYPREVCETLDLEKEIKKRWISKKKNWIFQSEIKTFEKVAKDLWMIKDENENVISYFRHPLSYLVEASDDICYMLMDLEDAVRLKILKIEEVKEMLYPIIKYFYEDKKQEKFIQYFEEKFSIIPHKNEQMAYLRAKVVWILIELIWNAFIENYEKIMNWELKTDLFKCLPNWYGEAIKNIKSESFSKIYSYKPVMEIEAAWHEIIWWLLECFIWTILYDTYKFRQYLELLPDEIKNIVVNSNETYYSKWRAILDYISWMTDNYALSLYKKLKWIELPRIY